MKTKMKKIQINFLIAFIACVSTIEAGEWGRPAEAYTYDIQDKVTNDEPDSRQVALKKALIEQMKERQAIEALKERIAQEEALSQERIAQAEAQEARWRAKWTQEALGRGGRMGNRLMVPREEPTENFPREGHFQERAL